MILTHAQSDIIGIIDTNGAQVVKYNYDTWGKLISIEGTLKDTLGVKNPYRYRGYRYDTETGLYYLQSRYYNPEWGRFINADALIGALGEILSKNMFAYCKNVVVNRIDSDGYKDEMLTGGGGGFYVPRISRWNIVRPRVSSARIRVSSVKVNVKTQNVTNGAAKAKTLANNRQTGRAYEKQEFNKFSSQNQNAVEQVTIKTPSGVRTRVDALGFDSSGNIVINEFKSSSSVPLTKNQTIAFPEIFEGGGTVLGKGKGIFTGGYKIPIGTEIKIIRP